jgi:hypothetical protein
MAAFVKFDPWAAIAAAKQRPAKSQPDEEHKPKTFATFAGFALRHPRNEKLESGGREKDEGPDTGNSIIPTADLGNKNHFFPMATAKAAKAAKADAKVAPRAAEPFPFADSLNELERRCPDHVPAERWQQCLIDAQRFLASWSDKAHALGWTADELFGLHEPPAKPRPTYSRLSRYDATGLCWLLQGRRVIALTDTTAAIENPSGAIVAYRKTQRE